ncbi:uncharacterized protein LOC119383879 [Rhipicephalus sanguineus]|uniref:uncharacterized protein LOC119383879 n=1 Tax=Rhipicephalus sanguineus TaxID=34632 RepID=UPI0018945D16|nr:uncharacterized protein LOC119383879 [Rhipicephalus sanguineus]
MATFTALMVLALAMAVASLDLHSLVKNPDLSPFQDPSRLITNHSAVYLLRVSVRTNTGDKIPKPQIPCVRSRYWSNTTQKVERSLDVYNRTDLSHYRSTNISLTVGKDSWQTVLKVETKERGFSIMNLSDVNITISHDSYSFLVLFSDANCLILAETVKIESIQRPWLRCSMWLPEHRILKPPKCCLFIFELLCSYMDDTVQVFDQKCLNTTAKNSKRT